VLRSKDARTLACAHSARRTGLRRRSSRRSHRSNRKCCGASSWPSPEISKRLRPVGSLVRHAGTVRKRRRFCDVLRTPARTAGRGSHRHRACARTRIAARQEDFSAAVLDVSLATSVIAESARIDARRLTRLRPGDLLTLDLVGDTFRATLVAGSQRLASGEIALATAHGTDRRRSRASA